MWLRSLWYILTLRCEEAERLRTVTDPSLIRGHQRIAERVHRGLCRGCRRAARELERIDRGLQELAGDTDRPDPEWNDDRLARLEAAFRAETRPGSGSPTDPAP